MCPFVSVLAIPMKAHAIFIVEAKKNRGAKAAAFRLRQEGVTF
jgi:hypothetical protein